LKLGGRVAFWRSGQGFASQALLGACRLAASGEDAASSRGQGCEGMAGP
jgi:hypothetical protein